MDRPEDKYVKLPALVHATRIGYTYMPIHDAESGVDYDGDTNIFYEMFRSAIQRINCFHFTMEQAHALVASLRLALSADDLGRAFFNCLQEGVDGVKLIDFDNPDNNIFQVATELPYANGDDSFRPDIVFLVNGMPLGFMEVKRQNNQEGILAERDRMYARFSNPIYKRFVNITQLMAFSNNQEYEESCRPPIQGSYYATSAYGKVLLHPFREEDEAGMAMLLADRNPETEQFILKDNNLASYYSAPEYEPSIAPDTPANRIVTSLFLPERFLFLLRYGIAYVERTTEEGTKTIEKHVMRYPQLFATFALRKKLDEGMRKGTIWHTQGSGKTALSFFLSRYLKDYYQSRGQVARFFFIVDRIDLADQAAGEFEARGCNVVRVNSRKEFQTAIASPAEKGAENTTDAANLTITVVNIQKFDDEAQAEGFDYALNVQRVFFIDEAHRDYKNGGKFLTQLVTSDRDAVRIALTGTPLIGKTGGNNTREVFGDYIHRYWYNQSIADGCTLRLLREDIQTEFKVKMQQKIQHLQEVNKLVDIKDVYEHDSFVQPLCDYIVDDYVRSQTAMADETIGAMVVATSAKQARKIHEYLQQFDPDIASELILHDEGSKAGRREICEDFKKDDSLINILVVYNMLLTGFDAHRLKKLYMCRTIAAHNLLQALTRVNRPYGTHAFGYVVDFADITEEYDKANRAYLAELNEEYGDQTHIWSTLFESQEQIRADLAHIKDVLFGYSTGNVVEFIHELDQISDKKKLYELRAALLHYRELRNVAAMQGYAELYEHFDLSVAQKLLGEVSNRISRLNSIEAMALKDMSTGAINELLAQIEFTFRNVGSEELVVADEFQDKLRRTYEAFGACLDPDDPEYVNLLEELRSKFAERNIEEMTSAELRQAIADLDQLRVRMKEHNRQDALLAKQYGGDAKFLRIHKRTMRTPPPLTESPATLFRVLVGVKQNADAQVLANVQLLSNEAYFKQEMQRVVVSSCKQEGLSYTAEQVGNLAASIASEYFNERKRAS